MTRRSIIGVLSLLAACQTKSKGDESRVERPRAETAAAEEPDEVTSEPRLEPREPTPVPQHLAALRTQIVLGQIGLASKSIGELVTAHPDDPWVLADAGFVTDLLKAGTGQELLNRALELADDASLRAQIKFYQARLVQWHEGFRAAGARELLTSSIAEFPLAPAIRVLELLDGGTPPSDPRVRDACDDRLRKLGDESKRWNCTGMEIDDSLWLRLSWVTSHGTAVRVLHEWRLAEPKPQAAGGLRKFDSHENLTLEDISICWGEEFVYVTGVFGGEGAVLGVERHEWESEPYVIVRCRTDEAELGGGPRPFPSSFFLRVCSLQSGWCSDEIYTKRVLHGGETIEAEVEVVDGNIIVREAGEEHIGVLP